MAIKQAAWLQRLKRYRQGRSAVDAWRRFGVERRNMHCKLLESLDKYPDSVLVAGCQRSGTTMLARLITGSDGMVDYYFGVDDEHDAALMLSGRVKKAEAGRYCFQTTYLNECYQEYNKTEVNFKLIWVVRNPYSVVCSLLYNWERFALNELFETCGADRLELSAERRYNLLGVNGLSLLERACYAYAGKTAQALQLVNTLSIEQIRVVDYEHLVSSKDVLLPKIYEYIDLPYNAEYSDRIHAHSLDKAVRLTKKQRRLIEKLCMPVYKKVLALTLSGAGTGF